MVGGGVREEERGEREAGVQLYRVWPSAECRALAARGHQACSAAVMALRWVNTPRSCLINRVLGIQYLDP